MNTKANRLVTCIGYVTLLASCQTAADAPAAETELEPEGGVITIWTDSSELFFEHPPLVANAPGEPWAVHVTILRSFQPVTAGALTLRLLGPDGTEHTHVTEQPSRPGHYGPAPSFETPGAYDLTVEVSGSQLNDVIYVGPVIVHASWEDVPKLEPEPPVGISFLKEQQWPIPFATVAAAAGDVATSIAAAGTIVPVANRAANVSAPVDGVLLANRNRNAAVPGQWVNAQQTLAVLSPAAGADAYATQRARAERLEREVARLTQVGVDVGLALLIGGGSILHHGRRGLGRDRRRVGGLLLFFDLFRTLGRLGARLGGRHLF